MSSICLFNQQIVGVVKDSKKIKNSKTSYVSYDSQIEQLNFLSVTEKKNVENKAVEIDILMNKLFLRGVKLSLIS